MTNVVQNGIQSEDIIGSTIMGNFGHPNTTKNHIWCYQTWFFSLLKSRNLSTSPEELRLFFIARKLLSPSMLTICYVVYSSCHKCHSSFFKLKFCDFFFYVSRYKAIGHCQEWLDFPYCTTTLIMPILILETRTILLSLRISEGWIYFT